MAETGRTSYYEVTSKQTGEKLGTLYTADGSLRSPAQWQDVLAQTRQANAVPEGYIRLLPQGAVQTAVSGVQTAPAGYEEPLRTFHAKYIGTPTQQLKEMVEPGPTGLGPAADFIANYISPLRMVRNVTGGLLSSQATPASTVASGTEALINTLLPGTSFASEIGAKAIPRAGLMLSNMGLSALAAGGGYMAGAGMTGQPFEPSEVVARSTLAGLTQGVKGVFDWIVDRAAPNKAQEIKNAIYGDI